MTYREAIDYLNSFVNYEQIPSYDYKTSFKLDRIYSLLELLKNPHRDIKVIHITGTKGKGSVAAITASILKAAGMRTGLYTSPHLISFRERIKIDDDQIRESEVADLVEEIKAAVDKSKRSDYTFFELYTALAFLYFRMKKVDFAVVEVGLGGRLDATNVVSPLVACITPISLEHTCQLGSTLQEIAKEKAAIIKRGCVCISGPQLSEAREIIGLGCRTKGVRLYQVQKDIFYEGVGIQEDRECFNILGIFGEYPRLGMRLLGEHQIINAATAIGIVEALRFHNIVILSASIREGVDNVSWPGRLEVIGQRPLVVVDGAQNRASAIALKDAVMRIFKFNKLILILGISKDKDIPGICRELEAISDEVILTKASSFRAEDPHFLKRYINKKFHITDKVEDAIELGKRISEDDDLILITGSLYVVGEAKNWLMANSK